MLVVSDSSPIISLSLIDRLDLLKKLYGGLLIPPTVCDEISGDKQANHQPINSLNWFETRSVFNTMTVALLLRELDLGEAEAIALTYESKADLLLLDDRKARSVAAYLGLPIAGLLDVLDEAKREKLIPAIKPILDDLIEHAKFRISPKLYKRTLINAGEMQDAESA